MVATVFVNGQTYDEMCRRFRWHIPEQLNIAAQARERHPVGRPVRLRQFMHAFLRSTTGKIARQRSRQPAEAERELAAAGV